MGSKIPAMCTLVTVLSYSSEMANFTRVGANYCCQLLPYSITSVITKAADMAELT